MFNDSGNLQPHGSVRTLHAKRCAIVYLADWTFVLARRSGGTVPWGYAARDEWGESSGNWSTAPVENIQHSSSPLLKRWIARLSMSVVDTRLRVHCIQQERIQSIVRFLMSSSQPTLVRMIKLDFPVHATAVISMVVY